MNKTVVFITYVILAIVGIVGEVFILLLRPEASTTFVNTLVLILGLAATTAGTFYGLGKTNEKIDQVKKQTNGTLTTLLEENKRKEEIIKVQTATITHLKDETQNVK